MTALSRNTASVAQDFHNAGGRDKAIIDKLINNNNKSSKKTALMNDLKSPNHQCASIEANQSFNENAYVFSTSIDDFTNDLRSVDSNDLTTMTTQKNVSPPAVQRTSPTATGTATANVKLRRKNLTNEKENEIKYTTDQTTMMMMHKQKHSSKIGSEECDWKGIRPRTLEEMSRRKQSLPKKCPNENENENENVEKQTFDDADDNASRAPLKSASSNRINAIRYKHLVRMVSKKESCKSCQRHTQCMVLPHHTKRSLLLHRFWRHSNAQGQYHCTKCGQLFRKKYKHILHMRLSHHH